MMVIMSIAFLSKEKGVATPSLVCEELGLSKSGLTAILNTLEDKKFWSNHALVFDSSEVKRGSITSVCPW